MNWTDIGEGPGRAEVGNVVALDQIDDCVGAEFSSAITGMKPFVLSRVMRSVAMHLQDDTPNSGRALAACGLLDYGAFEVGGTRTLDLLHPVALP
ncbi:MAG TPA: hypothetical protein VGZ22_21500 [Isosphaeraceae bacterium]|nr:hypothetical protein [Isosphaeraceae bacterium]